MGKSVLRRRLRCLPSLICLCSLQPSSSSPLPRMRRRLVVKRQGLDLLTTPCCPTINFNLKKSFPPSASTTASTRSLTPWHPSSASKTVICQRSAYLTEQNQLQPLQRHLQLLLQLSLQLHLPHCPMESWS